MSPILPSVRMVLAAACAALLAGSVPAFGAGRHSLSVGGRYHRENRVFTDLPFANDDISYALAYTFTDRYLGLQLGVGYAPDVSGARDAPRTNSVDYAVTPQANLVIQDRFLRGGVGILNTFVRDDEDNGDWLGLYYQILLGLNLPLSKALSLDAQVYYTLEKWSDIDRFRAKELEYGLWLTYQF